jgi:hypothetical protein
VQDERRGQALVEMTVADRLGLSWGFRVDDPEN